MVTTDRDVPVDSAPAETPPFARDATDVVATLGSDASSGLTSSDVTARLAEYGPNEITSEKPPSVWAVALGQLRDPMNIMLVAVTVGELRDRRDLDRASSWRCSSCSTWCSAPARS